jgi:hypothetical protein
MLLCKEPKERTKSEILMLMDYFKNNAFFKRTMEERKGDN